MSTLYVLITLYFVLSTLLMYNLIKKIYLLPVLLYRTLISPMTPATCRYHPTCSKYMMEAVMKWGIFKGTYLGIKRILRCHPWAKHEHFDPVPEPPKKKKS